MQQVPIPIVVTDGADLPEYATPGAAGMDLRASASVVVSSMGRAMVPTGLRISVPEGFEAQVRPRSGLSIKHGLTLINPPGTIDSDFRGEINVLVVNFGEESYTIEIGDRIAQLVICPVARAEWQVVGALPDSERGEGGFGSTGRQ
ncbi:MAG: dUTP diphosphatase [Chthonomonas sp.]|nr:dUTP diphosphatase [Chthonomonas sp.]